MTRKNISDGTPLGVTWDLSEFYSGMADPQIEKDKKGIQTLTQNFISTYKGNINHKSNTSEFLLQSLKDYSTLVTMLANTISYSDLLYVTDTTNEKKQAFSQSMHEFLSQIETQLVWYSLELIAIPQKKFNELISDNRLKDYVYFLEHTRALKPHTLSEAEEKILLYKSQTSKDAFVRLYSETRAKLEIEITVDGKIVVVPIAATSKYTHSTDRKVRKSVNQALAKKAEENKDFFKFVYNMILLDMKLSNELKNFESPYQSALLVDDVKREMVDGLVDAVWKRVDIVQRFYIAKKKLLGYRNFYSWDLYAPIFHTNKAFSWDETEKTVIKGITKASRELGAIAAEILAKKHVDSQLAPGKQGGAFCAYFSRDHLPYILTNFTGDLNSISTLAHELGHGFHGVLSYKYNTILTADSPLPIAEIASVFSESLINDLLLDEVTDTKAKIEFLNDKIIESISTVFVQILYFKFEQDVHAHRKEKGELSIQELYDYWNKHSDYLFGNVVEKNQNRGFSWMYIPHLYATPFYVYSYAFGELLSQALYERYKQEGDAFMNGYIEALKAGGSKSPADITKIMGVDISDANFWNSGLDLLDNYVTEFEQLAATV